MTTALPLLTLLALGLAPAGSPAPAATSAPSATSPAERLREPMTVRVSDAPVLQLVEKLATLLGVTPIVAPGVSGTVTISAAGVPVAAVLAEVEKRAGLSIRLVGTRLFVSRAGAPAPSRPLDDAELDRLLLADAALPRRPAGSTAGGAPARVRIVPLDAPGEATVWDLDRAGTVRPPGCPEQGMPLFPLGVDPFDRSLRLAVLEGPPVPGGLPEGARVLSLPADGSPVSAPRPPSACAGRYELRLVAEGEARTVEPLSSRDQFMLEMEIVQVSAPGEEVLSAPRIQMRGAELAQTASLSRRQAPGGVLLESATRIAAAVLADSADGALVAVVATVTRDVEPAPGEPPVRIRLAAAAETLRVAWGRKETVVLDPTYGRGTSALVLTVALTRLGR